MSDARSRLKAALPFLEMGANMARLQDPESKVMLAILSKKPDGLGQISTTLEFDGLIQDILALLGYDSMSALIQDSTESEENETNLG